MVSDPGTKALVVWVATVDGRLTVYTVLLTGAIFNAFSAALIYFLQSVASLQQLHEIVFYLMGRVPSPGRGALGLQALFVGLTVLALFAMSRDYNARQRGSQRSQSYNLS